MFTPALADLPQDPALTGAPTRVYLELFFRHLDALDFRAVKNWAIAKDLGMKPQTVGRALALLVEKGFLQRGAWERGTGRTYRVIGVRRPTTMTPPRHHSHAISPV